jgi:hypothetical protein
MSSVPLSRLKAAYEGKRLLDVLINNHLFRKCTANDLIPHGDWLKKIGVKILRGHRKVGDVFNETTLGWSFMLYHMTISELREAVMWSLLCDSKPAPGDEFDEEEQLDELSKIYRDVPLKK